jgi:hypothetical protein
MATRERHGSTRGEHQGARAGPHHLVVVPVLLVEPVTPDVPMLPELEPPVPEPVAPGVLLEEVSEPLVPPVPEAPIELVPPVLPVEPLALLSLLDMLPVLPVAPAVVDGLVLEGLVLALPEVPDGVVVLDVVLSVLSFLVQAPSDKAATTVNTAAAVWVRDVFMIRETPSESVRESGRGSKLLP